MKDEIRYVCLSNIGKIRDNNEDNFWCDGESLPEVHSGTKEMLYGTTTWKNSPLFGVFDGMGGETAGEVASSLAANTLNDLKDKNYKFSSLKKNKFLGEIFNEMNHSILNYMKNHHIYDMGTTANLALLENGKIHFSNLGDSRTYCYRDGILKQVSEDHVMSNYTFGKPPLTQFLGLEESEMELAPYYENYQGRPGDRILMCSDGLTDALTDGEIRELMRNSESIENAAETLMNSALKKGGRDNITILILELADGPSNTFFQKLKRCWGGKKHE